jgi:hypothetical protein
MIDRLEARLSAALGLTGRETAAAGDNAAVTRPEPPEEAVAAAGVDEAQLENGANVWPDESAEVAFFAEQREQGVPVSSSRAPEAREEVEGAGPLPALDELVKRIPREARELMDELFRAKFVTVKRVPKTALKE